MNPLLEGAPSIATRTHRVIHRLSEEVVVILRLIDRLKINGGALQDCPEGPAAAVRQIELGLYKAADSLLFAYAPRSK